MLGRLGRYVEQILSIYNHVDTLILTDERGYVDSVSYTHLRAHETR